MFRSGLPDFSAHYQGHFFAIEAKFVKAPPTRATSKVLGHELLLRSAEFLGRIHKTGGYGIVLIGFSDVAVAVPFHEWLCVDQVPDTNITLERVRLLGHDNLGFPKKNGRWEVGNFFNKLIQTRGSPAL